MHDQVTECREFILHYLKEQADATSVLDAILVIANERDEKHHAVTPGRMSGQWTYKLNDYLKWAKSQKGLDARALRKVDEAIEKLRDKKWT